MADGLSRTISEWRPVAELKQVKEDISAFGYSKEYIAEHRLEDKNSLMRHGHGTERSFQDRTLLLQINNDGSYNVSSEWNINLSSPNSMAVVGNDIYFGQNKMITRLNLTSGELSYFTNKSDEELAALKKMW